MFQQAIEFKEATEMTAIRPCIPFQTNLAIVCLLLLLLLFVCLFVVAVAVVLFVCLFFRMKVVKCNFVINV